MTEKHNSHAMSTGILLYISRPAAHTLFPHPLPECSRTSEGVKNLPCCSRPTSQSLILGTLASSGLLLQLPPTAKREKLLWAPKTMQDISITFACQPEFYDKTLLLKTLCILVTRHWEIKLDLSWKCLLRDIWWHYSPESQILLTLYRKQTKVQILSKPDMEYWGYLQEQKLFKDIGITKAYPSMGNKLLKAGNLESTAKLLGFLGHWVGLSCFQAAQLVFLLGDLMNLFLPGCFTRLWFFQVASLGRASSKQLSLPEGVSQKPWCLYLLGEEGPSECPPFQWLSEAVLFVYLLGIKGFTFP